MDHRPQWKTIILNLLKENIADGERFLRQNTKSRTHKRKIAVQLGFIKIRNVH